MALTRVLTEHTFKSSAGNQTYYFAVTVDEQSRIAVRNIKSPTGLIRDALTSLPQAVVDDIDEAMDYVRALALETEVHSGTIEFTGQTSRTATIPVGVLNNTNYRVVFTTADGIQVTASDKTVTSFAANTAVGYGDEDAAKEVGFSVLVATAETASTSGFLTFTDDTPGNRITVTFDAALPTTQYRVVLSPEGFFPVRVASRTKAGFAVELGVTPPVGEVYTVGFDVFV